MQKNRNDITNAVESKIYDNNQKEIIAIYVREVLADYRDSYFNLLDDHLQNISYDGDSTLQEIINQIGLIPPLWGSTGVFDPGAVDAPDINNCQGVVTTAQYQLLGGGSDCAITINFNQNISNRKIIVTVKSLNPDMNYDNDVCVPVIKSEYSSQQIKVALREVSGHVQQLKLEVFLFNVKTS